MMAAPGGWAMVVEYPAAENQTKNRRRNMDRANNRSDVTYEPDVGSGTPGRSIPRRGGAKWSRPVVVVISSARTDNGTWPVPYTEGRHYAYTTQNSNTTAS